MSPSEFSLVYITTKNLEQAKAIAAPLVRERLVACANILPQMISIYEWQDQVEESQECVVLLKTRSALIPQIRERVLALHDYDCPCVVVLPLVEGNPDFLSWISDQTQPR